MVPPVIETHGRPCSVGQTQPVQHGEGDLKVASKGVIVNRTVMADTWVILKQDGM